MGESLEGSFQVIKLLSKRPSRWDQCIAIGRLKFEKYFKRKVRSLLLKAFIYLTMKVPNLLMFIRHTIKTRSQNIA